MIGIAHEQIDEERLATEDRQIVTFNMETMVAATDNFHNDNKLGEGGFGPVYKVTTWLRKILTSIKFLKLIVIGLLLGPYP